MKQVDLKQFSDKDLRELHNKYTAEICDVFKRNDKSENDHLKELLDEGNRILDELEYRQYRRFAAHALTEWAKNPNKRTREDLRKYLENWLYVAHANDSKNLEYVIAHREMAIEQLTIDCINACSKEELQRIDDARHALAADLPDGIKSRFDTLEMF